MGKEKKRKGSIFVNVQHYFCLIFDDSQSNPQLAGCDIVNCQLQVSG